jgi:hypothetical protein
MFDRFGRNGIHRRVSRLKRFVTSSLTESGLNDRFSSKIHCRSRSLTDLNGAQIRDCFEPLSGEAAAQNVCASSFAIRSLGTLLIRVPRCFRIGRPPSLCKGRGACSSCSRFRLSTTFRVMPPEIVNRRALAIDFADFQVRQAGVPRSEWREGHQRSAMVTSKCGIDEFHKGMSSYRSRHLYSFRF